MKFAQACLVTGLVIGIPCVGFAQQSKGSPSDIKYCDALSKAYSSLFPAMEAMPAEVVHLVEGNLLQVVGVRNVSRVARPCLRQVA